MEETNETREAPTAEGITTEVLAEEPSTIVAPAEEPSTTEAPAEEPSTTEAPADEINPSKALAEESNLTVAPSVEPSTITGFLEGEQTQANEMKPITSEENFEKRKIDKKRTDEQEAMEDSLINPYEEQQKSKQEDIAGKDLLEESTKTSVQIEASHLGSKDSIHEESQILSKQELKVFTEMEEALLRSLRMDDAEFEEFLNPYPDKDVSLKSRNEDLRGLVANKLCNSNNLDLVVIRMLEERSFIVVYDEGTNKHKKIVNLLSALDEPFRLISKRILMSSKENSGFWTELIELFPPPVVLHGNRVYRDFEQLENFLYRKVVQSPCTPRETDYMEEHEFHVVVIGCSSAGFAAAMRASKYRDRVAIIDMPSLNYVKYIRAAKKIMHCSALMLEHIRLGCRYGLAKSAETKISWSSLVEQLTDLKKRNDFKRNLERKKLGIKVITARAKFTSDFDLALTVTENMPKTSNLNFNRVGGECYIIATGSQPMIPKDIIGAAEYCITTADLFVQKNPPGRCLIIGDSSDALECAGILAACDFDVTVISNDSITNRFHFEEEFVTRVRKHMESQGVRFVHGCTVLRVSPSPRDSGSRRTVEGIFDDGSAFMECFQTVIIDAPRVPCTSYMGLTKVGVQVNKDRYIRVDGQDRTTRMDVYALGDVAQGRPMSKEVSEKSAKYLIERLFNFGKKKIVYGIVPKVILTPLEYGYIGFTEDLAKALIKLKVHTFTKILVYESRFDPTTDLFIFNNIHLKLLVKEDDHGFKKLIGFHLLGNNVGEMLQGVYTLMQKYNYVERLDKVLSTHMGTRVLTNVILTRTYSRASKFEPVLSVKELISECKKEFESTKTTEDDEKPMKEAQESGIVKTADDEVTKKTPELTIEEEVEPSSKSLLSKKITEEDFYSFSESSSCESLRADFDTLKDKSEFMEMSFENEKIAESASQEGDSSSSS